MSRASLLSDLLSSIGAGSWFVADDAAKPVPVTDLKALCRKLVSSKGEATGVRLAAQILQAARTLDDAGIRAFFAMLADQFSPDGHKLAEAAKRYAAQPDRESLGKLQTLAEPPRQELFRRLNLAPRGTEDLVKLRERLLPLLKEDPDVFSLIDRDLRHLFASWFNRGFLLLRPIDWNTPALILEKIIAYEAVHEIGTWEELRKRLAPPDRRCFAFFHPSIPDDPLIFVEVALTRDTPASIASILDSNRTILPRDDMQTAVFYSISNCHKGLAGVSFGSFLIKQVAEDLKETIPSLKSFVTLSPVPGFARWLAMRSAESIKTFEPVERKALAIVAEPDWATDSDKAEAAKPGLLSLAARYFLRAKRPQNDPVDPVARFHLGNGAILNRIMHGADLSPSGLRQSHGIMVNYLYDLPKVEQRHEAYAAQAEVAASRAVTGLLPGRASVEAMKDVA